MVQKSAVRGTVLRWAVGTLMATIGAMMLVAPHQFTSPVYAGLLPQLPYWGSAFLALGIHLVILNSLKHPQPLVFVIHLLAGGLLLSLAVGFAVVGGWTGATNWVTLGLAVVVAPAWERVSSKGRPAQTVDLFALAVGGGCALTGLTVIAIPGQFISPIYDVIRSQLPALGTMFLASGVFLACIRLWPRAPIKARWAAHIFAGGMLLAFFLASALPLRAWIGIAFYGGFGLLVLLMPLLESRLESADPTSLGFRLALAFAVLTSVPLATVVALVGATMVESVDAGNTQAMRSARDLSFIILLAAVAVAVTTGTLVARWLAKPLGQLAAAALRFAAGDAGAALAEGGSSEVSHLSRTFSVMRDQLVAHMEERERLVEQLKAQNERLCSQNEEIQCQQGELRAQNEELAAANAGILEAKQALQSAYEGMEIRVQERTVALAKANEELRSEISARKRAWEALRKGMEGTINTVALLAERRDPYTAGHQRRVAKLAEAIGAEMGLAEERLVALRLAGAIHDIGKISIPAEILTKPSPLSDSEFALIRTHPKVAGDILRTIDFPWPLASITLQHHERFDGTGYPRGIAGEEILLEARILAVADVLEAMASHRPYRPALGKEKALGEISDNSGRLYDPNVVSACLRVMERNGADFLLA